MYTRDEIINDTDFIITEALPDHLIHECAIIGISALVINGFAQETDKVDIFCSDNVYQYLIDLGYKSIDTPDDMISNRAILLNSHTFIRKHAPYKDHLRYYRLSDSYLWQVETPASSFIRFGMLINDHTLYQDQHEFAVRAFELMASTIDAVLI